jgi:multidrug resistance efflux pump
LNYKGDLTSITRAHKEELLSLSAETEPAVQMSGKAVVSDTVLDSAQRAMTQAKTKEAGDKVMSRVATSVKEGRLSKDEATVLQTIYNKKFGGA